MRVMFVDDEPQVLRGITRMLECADVDWEIETAGGGAEALEMLESDPVDVLVSDMMMPGMDGSQLLEQVADRYPSVVRIILSGQATKESVFRAVKPMHQYLAKPCEADLLLDTISRACMLRETLNKVKSHDLLQGDLKLPSLPSLYQEIVAEMESEHGSVARVGEIISKDVAMTAKILQIANSALFGARATITSPAQAATRLGLDTLKALVLSVQVFQSFDVASIPGFNLEQLQHHCLAVGQLARNIAQAADLDSDAANEAFTAGLLHDTGKLVLAANQPDTFAKVLQAAKSRPDQVRSIEQELIGLGHDEIGGYLLALWGIPQGIVEAVAFHHHIEDFGESKLSIPFVVYLANSLVQRSQGSLSDEKYQTMRELAEKVGVADQLDAWSELASPSEVTA